MKNKLKTFVFLPIILLTLSSCGESKPSIFVASTGLRAVLETVEELSFSVRVYFGRTDDFVKFYQENYEFNEIPKDGIYVIERAIYDNYNTLMDRLITPIEDFVSNDDYFMDYYYHEENDIVGHYVFDHYYLDVIDLSNIHCNEGHINYLLKYVRASDYTEYDRSYLLGGTYQDGDMSFDIEESILEVSLT